MLCELRLKNLHTNQRDGGGPEQFVWNYFDLHMKLSLDGKSNLQDTSSLFCDDGQAKFTWELENRDRGEKKQPWAEICRDSKARGADTWP